MGAERPFTRSSRHVSRPLQCLGHFPGPEDPHGRPLRDLFHRRSHRAWFRQYLPAHRRPDSHWIWFFHGPSGVLRSK